jgi:hypothetical protein
MRWARGKAPSAGAQLLLFGLADRADPQGITYVGQETLAADCSCGETAVRENLRRLERHGLIARLRRHDSRGHRTSDFVVLAPLHSDRGEMVDVDDDDIERERYPVEVGSLARECHDETLQAEFLPAPSAPRSDDLSAQSGARTSPLSAPSAPRHARLPADCAEPNHGSRGAYPRNPRRLPTESEGEQLGNSVERSGEPTATVPAAEQHDLPADSADRSDESDGERWADFQAWWSQHPRITNLSDAWRRYTASEALGVAA